mmetsp:Transcript_11307/g.16835  ORF Transcript_11307/g.16835 Transcript_11307/m.16835 type:complete len:217 (-) Transcript_11307:210-860(-)
MPFHECCILIKLRVIKTLEGKVKFALQLKREAIIFERALGYLCLDIWILTVKLFPLVITLRQQKVDRLSARNMQLYRKRPVSKCSPKIPRCFRADPITIFVSNFIHYVKRDAVATVQTVLLFVGVFAARVQIVVIWVWPAILCMVAHIRSESIVGITLVTADVLEVQRHLTIQRCATCFRDMNVAVKNGSLCRLLFQKRRRAVGLRGLFPRLFPRN